MSSSETSSTPTEPAEGQVPRAGLSFRSLLLIGLLALGLIIVGILAYPRSPSTGSSSGGAQVGKPVPSFSGPRLGDSGSVGVPESAGGKGHPAVLIFWGSWCSDCKTEMPALAAAINEGKAGSATVLGIDALDNDASALAFVAANDMRFASMRDPEGLVTNGTFGFAGLPYTVFVNAKGIVTEIHPGVTSPDQLAAGVAKLG